MADDSRARWASYMQNYYRTHDAQREANKARARARYHRRKLENGTARADQLSPFLNRVT